MSNLSNEILLLTANLSQQKDKDSIIRLFIEGLNNFFENIYFQWKEKAFGNNVLEICTRNNSYGSIYCDDPQKLDSHDMMLLKNATQMIAVFIERVEQENLLRNKKKLLEEIVRDKTKELINSREELKKSKLFTEKIVNTTPNLIYVFNLENHSVVYVNEGIKKILGYSPQQIQQMEGDFLNRIVHPDDLEKVNTYFNDLKKSKKGDIQSINFRAKKQNGNYCYLENQHTIFSINKNNIPKEVIGISLDITHEIKVKKATVERQKYLEGVLNAAPDAIVTLDAKHKIIEWNKGSEKLFGYTKTGVLGKNIDNLITKGKKIKEAKSYTTQVLNGKEIKPHETIRYRKDGKPVDVIAAGSPIFVNNELIGVIAVYTDITKRKEAERALLKSEENLRITLNSIGDGVIATDKEGKVTSMNPIAEQLTGWNVKEATGNQLETIFRIVNAKTNKKADNPVSKVLKTGKIVGLANHTKLISKVGREYQIADSGAPIRQPDGEIIGVVLVFRDVTEEYRMRDALDKKILALTQPIKDSKSISFESLFNLDDIQKIQDQFSNATGGSISNS